MRSLRNPAAPAEGVACQFAPARVAASMAAVSTAAATHPAPAVGPPAGAGGIVARVVLSPGRFCLAILVITTLGLWLDSQGGMPAQHLLSLATWGFLLTALRYATSMERSQTAVVVAVATAAELMGSVWWGVYEYRLGNLPLFVPAGHGLVYLTGLRLSQSAWATRHRDAFVRAAIAGVLGWAALGLFVLERRDVAGAVGAVVLAVFLLRGRAPQVYAGVFFFVAYLEIYGTAVGTWTWAEHIPALGIPDGNPPSGAASGYVLFDIAALAFAPSLLALAVRVRQASGWRWRRQAAAWSSSTTPASVTSAGHSGAGAPASSGGAVTTAFQRDALTAQPISAKSSSTSCSRSGGPTSR
jgi:hypothetical protein